MQEATKTKTHKGNKAKGASCGGCSEYKIVQSNEWSSEEILQGCKEAIEFWVAVSSKR